MDEPYLASLFPITDHTLRICKKAVLEVLRSPSAYDQSHIDEWAQETAIALWSLDEHGKVKTPGYSLILGIARNIIHNSWRERNSEKQKLEDYCSMKEQGDCDEQPHANSWARTDPLPEEWAQFRDAARKWVSPEDRPFFDYFLETSPFSGPDAAHRFGLSLENVRKKVQRIRETCIKVHRETMSLLLCGLLSHPTREMADSLLTIAVTPHDRIDYHARLSYIWLRALIRCPLDSPRWDTTCLEMSNNMSKVTPEAGEADPRLGSLYLAVAVSVIEYMPHASGDTTIRPENRVNYFSSLSNGVRAALLGDLPDLAFSFYHRFLSRIVDWVPKSHPFARKAANHLAATARLSPDALRAQMQRIHLDFGFWFPGVP